MARIELITEDAPFTHHAQGITSLFLSPSIFIAAGNGIPIRIPIGHNVSRVTIPLSIRFEPKKKVIIYGRKMVAITIMMERESIILNSFLLLVYLFDKKLPIPEKMRMPKSAVDTAYTG